MLPGAHSAETWIQRSRVGTPCLSTIPEGRWPMAPTSVHHPEPGTPDRTPCLTGGFVGPHEVSADLEVPAPLHELDPLFGWLIDSVHQTLESASIDRERTSLWLANLSLPSSGAVRTTDTLGGNPWLEGGHPLDRHHSHAPAALAAQTFGLGGGFLALDAACASGLYAVQLACDQLASGEVDAAIAAGLQGADSSFLHLGFAQLLALSPTGTPRPLDSRGDGLVVGEGAAAVLLKRLSDAQRDGDTIHAVIRGGGLGNDGRSGNLLAPRAVGQSRTLRAALAAASATPATVGYVECHATGTRKGDRTELDALLDVYGDRETPLVLGSTKGIVGHTITVAGIAGLIRAAGAVRDGILPATPWATQPLTTGALAVLAAPQAWDGPRRAAVSAFGFGGTNAHLILDAPNEVTARPESAASVTPELAVVGIAARVGDTSDPATLRDALCGTSSLLTAAPESARRGLGALPDGAWVESLQVDAHAARIPPTELPAILPQQLLALQLAAEAGAGGCGESTAVVVGMGIDLHVADHVVGWARPDVLNLAPALNTARVQGVLPNFVANRVSARFGLQGPSLTVSAGEASLQGALRVAARLLANSQVSEAIVGVVDLPGHRGALVATAATSVAEGGVFLRVKTLAQAQQDGDSVLATLPATLEASSTPWSTHASVGQAEVLEGGLSVLKALLSDAPSQHSIPTAGAPSAVTRVIPGPARWTREAPSLDGAIRVPHSPGPVSLPAFSAPWSSDAVPVPVPGPPRAVVQLSGTPEVLEPLTWAKWIGLPAETATPAPSATVPRRPTPTAAPSTRPNVPRRPSTPRTETPPAPRQAARAQRALPPAADGTAQLALAMARATDAVTAAHATFLASQSEALGQIAEMGRVAAQLENLALRTGQLSQTAGESRRSSPQPQHPSPPPIPTVRPTTTTAQTPVPQRSPSPPAARLSRADLEHLASGDLSTIFGPAYADLDAIEPRVRLPEPPLLLVSRVLDWEGTRGVFGPSRMVTEYDLDPAAPWNHDGRPPPCVVVESGQADLLLVAILGIDGETQGKQLYRLLDCDLTFHCDRPTVGHTLRHDIRIERFAKLGATTLFYFQYDCTLQDGTPVLTMRNGVAGFFSPAALATPHGADDSLADVPDSSFCAPTSPSVDHLHEAALAQLTAGHIAEALGVADTTSGLSLPPKPWGLLSRVTALSTRQGPHGLGLVQAQQDLDDDDWFNHCHFKGDPCMPGTLMFDGCTQALSVWMLAAGLSTGLADAHFEPYLERATVLRCRGQIVPGHTRLDYEVRVKDAGLEPEPWALADVILSTNGTPIVRAEDVGLRIVGRRVAPTIEGVDTPDTVQAPHFVEHAMGSHVRAYGEGARVFDDERRGPRIPGPPLQLLHRAHHIDVPVGTLKAGTGATAEVDLPADAWWWQASPDTTLPLVILLEAALQPCGWFTAWAGAALQSPNDLYFRNLGGTARLHADVTPDIRTLTTRATLTDTSNAGGMLLTFFDLEVYAGDTLVFSGDTHFGYFTKAALAGQKGLPKNEALPIEPNTDLSLADWTGRGAPRADLRMIDRIVQVNPTGGSAGLGRYAAELDVVDDAWFFTAHFHEDPVMPGSLGLEALAQLLRWVHVTELHTEGALRTLLPEADAFWKYRGQVLRGVRKVRVVVDIMERSDTTLVANGTVYADDLGIYRLDGLGCEPTPAVVLPATPALPAQPSGAPATRVTALLDHFTVDGVVGHGVLRLDPARDPWLRDHCPTLVTPAMPMAFAAEVAAEAALQLRPEALVVGLPELHAKQWLHTGDGPVDVLVVAVLDGDTVAVSLAVDHDGDLQVHMSAVVTLAATYPEAPVAPDTLAGQPVELSVEHYYSEGHTFHGAALQGMTDLGTRSLTPGAAGAEATFHTRPDTQLLPQGAPSFVLDPLLLDTATHPMMSSQPHLWVEDGKPGRLAYPVSATELRFFGPRPEGEVRCRLNLIESSMRHLVFDVTLVGSSGVWATFRWTEALVPGGLLGRGAEIVRSFAIDGTPSTTLGAGDSSSWQLRPTDLVEPIPGTLRGLLCHAQEDVPNDVALRRVLASKELVRARLREHGHDVHPRRIALLEVRPGRYIVQHISDLDVRMWTRWLHPTVFTILATDAGRAESAAGLCEG